MHRATSASRPAAAAEWRWVAALTLLLVAALNAPYALAYAAPDRVFTGILFNPSDGNSYFAKMQIGLRGEWLFTLPYTAEPGPGVFIFTYYLLLGHLARWTGLSLDAVYALARAAGGALYLLAAFHFLRHFFSGFRNRLAAWLFLFFSSGLGWLAVFFGQFTADLWVAEAFPFLTVFSNAHFSLTAALLLWLFELALPGLSSGPPTARRLALTALVTTLMAQTQPLALITAGLVLGAATAWRAFADRRLTPALAAPLLVFGAAAGPWLVYGLWITRAHPILSGWSAQNVTPSPPLWELIVSGGVPLGLALPGIYQAARRRRPQDVALLLWLGLGALSLYAPFALQRRLSLGLWMPLAVLAARGFGHAVWPRLVAADARRKVPLRFMAATLLASAALLSNVFVYAATLHGVQRRQADIFLTLDEAEALAWLAQNASGAVVLAGPETGLFIPARSNARVVYGHLFETVEAETRAQEVVAFYAGGAAHAGLLAEFGVKYVFYGPREAELGPPPALDGWRVVFERGAVQIYGR